MNVRPFGMLLTAAALMAAPATPGNGQQRIVTPPVEQHRLVSSHVGDSFQIRVMLPPMIPGEKTRFPVVYLTDTHAGFGVNEDILRLLMLSDTPRFIAVGIGYPAAQNILQGLVIRGRDLTPTTVSDFSGGLVMAVDGTVTPKNTSGGAAQFLRFLRDELMPFIDARYPTNPADRVYFGHSLGGLFGSYVLFTEPGTFKRYIIGSPSLWWDGGVMLKRAEEYLKVHQDLAATVFLGVGAREEEGPAAFAKMVTNTLTLETMLRAKRYPGLTLTSRVFADETHVSVVGSMLVRGLMSVFGPVAPEASFMAQVATLSLPGPETKR